MACKYRGNDMTFTFTSSHGHEFTIVELAIDSLGETRIIFRTQMKKRAGKLSEGKCQLSSGALPEAGSGHDPGRVRLAFGMVPD